MSQPNSARPDDQAPSSSSSDRTPDEIEGQIEHTREQLTRTLDALQSRLSPRERLRAASESARAMGGRVMRTVTDAATPDVTTMIRMDHTHVLALFRRFRPTTSLGRKRALVANACLALEIHAQLEEEIFYPTLRQAVGANEMLDKSVPEHGEMRRLIGALRASDPADPGFERSFHALMRTVLHHVADEESLLLPLAEDVLADRLGTLGAQMTKRRLELLKPHLGEVAVTTARSFPVATAAAVAAVCAFAWLIIRPSRRT